EIAPLHALVDRGQVVPASIENLPRVTSTALVRLQLAFFEAVSEQPHLQQLPGKVLVEEAIGGRVAGDHLARPGIPTVDPSAGAGLAAEVVDRTDVREQLAQTRDL